jgi:hypothetical protein
MVLWAALLLLLFVLSTARSEAGHLEPLSLFLLLPLHVGLQRRRLLRSQNPSTASVGHRWWVVGGGGGGGGGGVWQTSSNSKIPFKK